MDILTANRLAAALTPALHPGANSVRALFMEPAVRRLYNDGEQAAHAAVRLEWWSAGTRTPQLLPTRRIGRASVGPFSQDRRYGPYGTSPR